MARKGNQKGELSKKQMRSITTLDAVVNATKRMAKDRNVDIEFYDQEYKQYFADFVRILRDDKALSDDECLKILNDDFLKNVNGGILPHTKQRSLSQAYTIYKNAVAYAETQIKEEYGADNYYDLEKSKDPKAREAFERFEAWQKRKDDEFEQLADITEQMLEVQHSANPLKTLSQTGIVIGPLLIGLGVAGATTVGGMYASNYLAEKFAPDYDTENETVVAGTVLSLIGGAILCAVVYCSIVPSSSALQLDLNDFAKAYGFSNGTELINAVNNSLFQYLTPEEAKTIYASMQDVINEGVATQYNLDSYEQALQIIENAKSTELVSKSEALQDIANERALALDTVARQNGFNNYEELVQYLQQHKVEVADRLRQPIDNAYDSQTPKALSSIVENVQDYYNAKVTEINSINWPRTMEVIDDETVKNMAMQFSANEAVLNSAYENLMIDDANVFYSPDITTQMMGVDTLEVVGKHGVDTITDTKHSGGFWPESKASAMDAVDTDLDVDVDGVSDAIGDAVQTIDISALDAVAGVGVGAGLTVALKNSKLIKDSAKMHHSSKLLKKLREIEEQSNKDVER